MDLSLDDVISYKQRGNRGSYNSSNRGRGRGSMRIGAKQFKTLTIKKSKLAGVDLPLSSSRFDDSKPLVISSSTPGKRYFSNAKSDFSSQSNFNKGGFKGRNQAGIQSRIGGGRREDDDNTGRPWNRGVRTNRRNRGARFSLDNTVPRVNQQDRGFKGLASSSKRMKGITTDYLRSPSKNSNLITQHIDNRSRGGSGFRFNRSGRGRGRDNRNRDNRRTYDEQLDIDQDDSNIQVTFANPKASSRSNRQTDYPTSSKESSKRFSSTALSSDPGENILISVQNENARAYVPEGVEIDPTFITHKTHSSLNERFSQNISFEGKERIIQKHSMH